MASTANPEATKPEEDLVIAVIGSKGAGKTSFIKFLVGDAGVSSRGEVQPVSFTNHSGHEVVVLNTQTFDAFNPGITCSNISKSTFSFLLKRYGKERKLNGLVYLHRIEGHTNCQSTDILKLFKDLCGTETLKKVVVLTLCDQISNKGEGTRRDELLEELAKGGAFIIQDDRNNEHFRHVILRHFITPSEGRVQDGDRANRKNSDTIADKEKREQLEQQLERQQETISKLTKAVEDAKIAQEVLKRKAAEEKKVLMVRHSEEIRAKEEETKKRIDALQHQLAQQDEEPKKALSKVPQDEQKQEASEEKNDDGGRSKQKHERSSQRDCPTEANRRVEQTRPDGEDRVARPGDFNTALRNGTDRPTTGGTYVQNQEAGREGLQQQLALGAGLKSEKDANGAKTGQEKPTEKTHVDGQTDLNQQSDRSSKPAAPLTRPELLAADRKEPQRATGMQNEVAGPKESIMAPLELGNWVDQQNANVLNPTSAKEDATSTRRERISKVGQHVSHISPLPKGSHIEGEMTATHKAATQTPKEESNRSQRNTETKSDVIDTVDDATMVQEKGRSDGLSKQEHQWLSRLQTMMAEEKKATRAELGKVQAELVRQEKERLELKKDMETARVEIEKLRKEADAKSEEMVVVRKHVAEVQETKEKLKKLAKEMLWVKERRENAKITQEDQKQGESSGCTNSEVTCPEVLTADHKEPEKATDVQHEVAGPKESIMARLELGDWVDRRNANVLNPTSAKEDAAFTRRENISEDVSHISPLRKGSHIDGEMTAAHKAATQTTNVEEDQSIKEESNQSQRKIETKSDMMDTVDDGTMGPSKQERQGLQTRLTQSSTKAELEMLQEKLTKGDERLQKLEKDIFFKERREDAKMTQEIQNQRESSDAFDLIEHEDDVIIVVMGSTGTGKSSFIRLISGDTTIRVADSLKSETSEIHVVRFVDPNSSRNMVIVDTPGFDDSRSEVTDTDILKKITAFLLDQYDKQRKLNGLVFLQRISDPRFGNQSGRNLRMFKGLCGSENYENVVVLTTNWDRVVNKEEGDRRETELKNVVFKELLDGGAKFMRHKFGNMETARDVLEHIFTLRPTDIAIQKEMRVEGKVLEETTAGSVHRDEIEQLIAKHREDVANLREEMKMIPAEKVVDSQAMRKEAEQLNEKLARFEKERLALREGLDTKQAQGPKQPKTHEELSNRQKSRNKFLRFF